MAARRSHRPHPGTSSDDRDHLEASIERALVPGAFIDWRGECAFASGVDATRSEVAALTPSDPVRAVALFETFLAACQAKADEVDDSSGSFGDIVGEIALDWIRARQAAGAAAEETVATIRRWTAVDPYGHFHDLEKAAAPVLDDAGVSALERCLRADIEGARANAHAARRAADALRAIHVRRGDPVAYESLARSLGGPTPRDCEILAKLCIERCDLATALAWADRGLAPRTEDALRDAAWGLDELRREILVRMGRGVEALADTWEQYRAAPSFMRYETMFLYVPEGERATWHARAIAALEGADLDDVIDVLAQTGEAARLAEVVEGADRDTLVRVVSAANGAAAGVLETDHPLLAAKVHTALALRILAAKDAKLYQEAHRHLERARDALLANRRRAEWVALVTELRAEHHRKRSFLPGLEVIAAGGSVRPRPFLETARECWAAKMKDEAP